MSRDLSFEDPELTFFITTRTIASRLWFVNNRKLHRKVAAFLAKYQRKFGVILHAFIIMGNHYHLVARFPRGNKAKFLKAFNSIFARLVEKMVPEFHGGKVWARPARCQVLPEPQDIEHWTLYCALNPVESGLTQKYTEYDTFNSFSPAIAGKTLQYELVNWSAYNNAKRVSQDVHPKQYTEEFTLTFSRIPGYESLSQREYMLMMEAKAEKRRNELIKKRFAEGKGFAGVEALRATVPGAFPKHTKKADRYTKRPLVLSLNPEARKIFIDRYFRLLEAYRIASKRFRDGDLNAEFPPGTYRPPLFCPL